MTQETQQINPKNIPFDKNLPTALFLIRDDGGCGYYRMLQPAMYLRRRKLFNTITDMKNTTREHILQSDIIIFQHIGSTVSIDAFNFAIENKKPVIVEVDDMINAVSPNNIGGYGAWNFGTLFIPRAIEQMKKAMAMTVSTEQLAREHFVHNKNIYVLPNYLSKDKWDLSQNKQKDGITRIGWAGGNAHLDDLRLISKVIEKIVIEYKGKVKFETMGMLKKELQDTFKIKEFNDRCPKCDYQGEIITWPGETLDNYPLVLASHGWDIALAPIINNAFNSAKSDLKLKEYAAIGYPIIASRCTPYIEAFNDGCEVLLADTFQEWYNNIKKLIEDPDLRQEMAKKNKKWVTKYWIEDNIDKFADVYNQIINNHKKI